LLLNNEIAGNTGISGLQYVGYGYCLTFWFTICSLRVLRFDINRINRNIWIGTGGCLSGISFYEEQVYATKFIPIKREVGRNLEYPKTEVSFAVVDSDIQQGLSEEFSLRVTYVSGSF
jgi:hypothetical protein